MMITVYGKRGTKAENDSMKVHVYENMQKAVESAEEYFAQISGEFENIGAETEELNYTDAEHNYKVFKTTCTATNADGEIEEQSEIYAIKKCDLKAIKNADEITEELAELLIGYTSRLRVDYDTDIYAYYNERTREVTLDEFINVGGNSWLDDDHITIYRDHQKNEDIFDTYNNKEDLAAALDISEAELTAQVAAYRDEDPEDLNFYDYAQYMIGNADLMDALEAAYVDAIEANSCICYEIANEIIEKLEDRIIEKYNIETW